jgi:ribosomal protein S12 methylthiotransferase
MPPPPTTVALISLGCPKNLVDAEHLLGLLDGDGFRVVEEPREAAVIIVNTCAFIEPAEEEAVEALLDMADLKREGRCRVLLATGCLPQRRGEELLAALPEVDGFLGVGALPRIGELVTRALAGERLFIGGDLGFSPNANLPRWRSGAEWLAYLRIADGCSHRCTFCTIPGIRGDYRSRPVDDVLAEFGALVASGTREVCLIAQDTTAYGRDLPEKPSLAQLLRRMGEVPFGGWVRLLYGHPRHVTDDLLQAMTEVPAVVPYLDIPLQHASRSVLQRMGRAGGRQEYLDLIANIRGHLPSVALRTTFIVGFPGETEADFAELLEFVEAARLDRVSAFRYWEEEGTPAAALPDQVPEEDREERLARLLEVQEPISLTANQHLVGQRLRVLAESRVEGLLVGRSYRDAPEVDGEVKIRASRAVLAQAPLGRFVEVRVTRAEVHDLEAELD